MSSIGGGATAERNGQAGGSPAGNACTPGQSLTPRTDAAIAEIAEAWRVPLFVLNGLCEMAIYEAVGTMLPKQGSGTSRRPQ